MCEEQNQNYNHAIEELKLLQQIIGRYDDHEIKIRSWLLGLLAALCVALFSNKIEMTDI